MRCASLTELVLGCAAAPLLATAHVVSQEHASAKTAPVHADGLHNLLRVHPLLYSGGGPDGDRSFQALRSLGVKTIISVDGARPDLARATRFGMSYVHVPIGYNGVPRDKGWVLAQALADLPGPFYVHCHHGNHRGPTAAALGLMCLDEGCRAMRSIASRLDALTAPWAPIVAAPVQAARCCAAAAAGASVVGTAFSSFSTMVSGLFFT